MAEYRVEGMEGEREKGTQVLSPTRTGSEEEMKEERCYTKLVEKNGKDNLWISKNNEDDDEAGDYTGIEWISLAPPVVQLLEDIRKKKSVG
eukprot:gene11219-7791_t